MKERTISLCIELGECRKFLSGRFCAERRPQSQTGTLIGQRRLFSKADLNGAQASALGGLANAAPLDKRAKSGDQACGR